MFTHQSLWAWWFLAVLVGAVYVAGAMITPRSLWTQPFLIVLSVNPLIWAINVVYGYNRRLGGKYGHFREQKWE